MKSSKLVGVWRPLMGVAVVGAMALGVSALAAPRGADQAVRGTGKSGTEVTRLVTGDPAQINAVVAGTGPTVILAVNPVNPPPGMAAYPAGVTIVGNELRIDRNNKDRLRAWFHVQLSKWDPLGNGPDMGAYQIKLDCSGYAHSDCKDLNPDGICVGGSNAGTPCPLGTECTGGGSCGLDLIPAIQPCGSNTDCRSTSPTGFGESWAKCGGVICDNGYLDNGGTGTPSPEAESWCEPTDGGCAGFGVAVGTCNYNYFSVSDRATLIHPEFGRIDNHQLYYGGTLVLDLPAGAKGKYTVNLNTDETFASAPGSPPVVMESFQETGFVVNFVTGSCCFKLGTPTAGCNDQCLNRSDCTALGAPSVFTPGALCANKPTDDGCVECVVQGVDPLCNDGDSCTTETCNASIGVCIRGTVPGWDPATECCDGSGANPVIASFDDGNPCTDDTCNPGPVPPNPPPNSGNGVPKHTPSPSTTPCDDLNPCSVGDHCGGPPSISCTGTDVNTLVCPPTCPNDPAGTPYACVDGKCFCTLTPTVTFEIPVGEAKTCVGGPTPGGPCASNADCGTGGVCDNFADGANCFDEGEKFIALVHIGASGSPVNGGQFQIEFDPSCVELKSVTCMPPYGTEIYRSVSKGKIFIACGVNPFCVGANCDGPFGGVDMVSLSFNKIGECNNCFLRFTSTNPQNSYLVDEEGQRIAIEPVSKELAANGDLVLNVPENIKTNVDCDSPVAVVLWNPDLPNASFSCGEANLTCRGAHTSGYSYPQSVVLNGGQMLPGSSSFCCYAWAKHKCDQVAGCPGAVNDCGLGEDGKPDGCWTVEVNDETSLDIDVQLCPLIATGEELTRCIKFCLFANCVEEPICFSDDVTFGGSFNFIGKSGSKIKIPGSGQWDCITAQDQLHTLRSCYTFDSRGGDCVNGQLHAQFTGDHQLDGNCLLGGNLDGWKKDVAGSNPSLDVIDILDYGTFISQYGLDYGTGDTPCPAVDHGPNADINGDGLVTMADYLFVLANFLVSAKDCCCGPQAADLPPALAEVTIDELRQMGLDDLIVADLNADGVLNAADMDAFLQGARPAKSNDRKGGKGLRSGR